jgi:hypothetical protein
MIEITTLTREEFAEAIEGAGYSVFSKNTSIYTTDVIVFSGDAVATILNLHYMHSAEALVEVEHVGELIKDADSHVAAIAQAVKEANDKKEA